MLSINDARIVQKAVNREIFNGEEIFSLEDAICMTCIPSPPNCESYNIFAIQVDNMTILVWVLYTDVGIHVRMVHRLAW